jgi:hypothetical protein
MLDGRITGKQEGTELLLVGRRLGSWEILGPPYGVLRDVDSMPAATIRCFGKECDHGTSADAAGVGLIGGGHVKRNEIDGNAARSFKP